MTRPFRIAHLAANHVSDIRDSWDAIDFAPVYQRQADIWGEAKKQLFIDSLVNGYDVPKFYFHDLSWKDKGSRKRYAIIDGKQRLLAIRGFVDGEFTLSSDFEDIEVSEGHRLRHVAAGKTYSELTQKHAALKARLDDASLPIVLVQTEDLEFIEEMFSRLNEAVPLNAPEKRNALGGPLPRQIRRLAQEEFFTSRLARPNTRYRHLDLATKFLYMEYKGGLVDLKKRDLDRFVKHFKTKNLKSQAETLFRRCALILNEASAIFIPSDPLLDSVGMVTVYYHLVRQAFEQSWLDRISRDLLVLFEDARNQNREKVREAQELALEGRASRRLDINPVLSQFERYVQSPNDVTALTWRHNVLRYFVREGRVPSPSQDIPLDSGA